MLISPSPLGLGLGYKVGDLFLKTVIPSWEIYSIEVLCGFVADCLTTYALKTLVNLSDCLNG